MEVVKARNSVIIRKAKTNSSKSSTPPLEEEDVGGLRRGPWSVEEDFKLIHYIASHGEGRWNYLARCAGLKRTGKSCRLRWLNYLRPDLRRGNITLEEQLMILQLHSRWGNRWSKIAQHLPGRTDNEIKNYWRTRVQKQAKQLKCDVDSKQFKDAMRHVWMPRLMERIQAATNAFSSSATTTTASNDTAILNAANYPSCGGDSIAINNIGVVCANPTMTPQGLIGKDFGANSSYTPDTSSTAVSLDSLGTHVSPISNLTTDCYNINIAMNESHGPDYFQVGYSDSMTSSGGYFNQGFEHFHVTDQNNQLLDSSDNFWNVEHLMVPTVAATPQQLYAMTPNGA